MSIANQLESMLKDASSTDPFDVEVLNSSELKIWLKGFLAGKAGQKLTSEDTIKIIKMIEAMKDHETIFETIPSNPRPYLPAIPYRPTPWYGEPVYSPPSIWCNSETSNDIKFDSSERYVTTGLAQMDGQNSIPSSQLTIFN